MSEEDFPIAEIETALADIENSASASPSALPQPFAWKERYARLFDGWREKVLEPYLAENRASFYEKKRAADRAEYAAKIRATQGRDVRPYRDLYAMTLDQKADHVRERERLKKQRQRATKAGAFTQSQP